MHCQLSPGRTRRPARALLTTLALFAALSTLARASNEESELLGLRHRNNTVNGPLTMVSFAGGLEFFIDGAGMDDQPHINAVMFRPTQSDDIVTLTGPPLIIDDEIQSATALGRLAYTMPPITEILGGVPIEAINNHFVANADENLEFLVRISNTADATDGSCPEDWEHKCKARFSMRYTPLLHDVSPSNVYLDQQLSILVNPQAANEDATIGDDYDPVVHIKFSGTRCDAEGLYDYETRLSSYNVGSLKTRAGDQHPGNQIPEVRFRVGNAYLRESAKHCNFAGDDCWYVKTHPKIDTVSATDGYITGGQTITIDGWGLKGATGMVDIDINVDGVPCAVTSHSLEQITCVTGAAEDVSLDGVSQPGSPGLTQQVLNDVDNDNANPYWDMQYNGAVPVEETKLLTAFENSYSNYTRAGTVTKGWFKAPETGNFRFYISCNAACRLHLDATNKFNRDDPIEPVLEQLAIRHSATSFRNYNLIPDEDSSSQYISEWIAMEAGEYYKIEGFMMEYAGDDDHFTVSVEFEQADSTGHHHAMKEVQMLSVDPENVSEKYQITVTGAMGGSFQIMFVNPLYDPNNRRSIQLWTTDPINDNQDDGWMRRRIVNYYYSIWGSNIAVTHVDYDESDVETTSDLRVKRVYTIEVLRQINGPSFTVASIIPAAGTTSTITIASPYDQSTPPLSGKWFIACPNDDGTEFRTRDMGIYWEASSIDFYLQLEIPHLQFKTMVRDTGVYTYRDNGIGLYIVFQDYHGDVPQCEIRTSESNPLDGIDMTLNWSTVREYGQNLFFEPMPLEFMYTDVQKPQVTVTVNGIDAVCPDFNCDYTYIDTDKIITAQSLSSDVNISIVGTGLPTEDIVIEFANVYCPSDSIVATDTQIDCTLNAMPAAGSWDVKLIDYRGLIPIDSAVVQIDVALVIDSISPDSGLNQLGGDILTLTGSGFDDDLTHTTIIFSDNTSCDAFDASPTELKCVPYGFDVDTLDTVNPYTLTVTVNEVVNSDLSVMLLSTKQSGQTVSPSSVSPVLATVLTVNLEDTYPETLVAASDFSATLISRDDPTIIRPLYVMSVDDSTKSLRIKFPGAESGNYNIFLVGAVVGRIDREPLALTVTGQVTAISPLSGSYLGGTLMTIDGVNFSDDPLDNPVKVGPFWCLVETTNESQITCRVVEAIGNEISTAIVVTFLRTSEEAINLVSNIFEFSDPIATITGLSTAFDAATNTAVITLEGTGFTAGVSDEVTMIIDGVEQTSLEVTDLSATFEIVGMDDETSSNVEIYFPDGLPSGYADFNTITATPTLISVSPSSGSSGGTLLTVTGTGFGINTSGVNLFHEASGAEICAEVTVTGYGTFTCLTNVVEINAADTILLKTDSGSYACGNTLDSTLCFYEQLDASSPAVTAATVTSANSILIEGTGFPTSGYAAIVLFKGIESSSSVISDATSMTVTFDNGIPVSEEASAPSVRFVPDDGRRRLVSLDTAEIQLIATQVSVTILNNLSVASSTSGLSCSFQGGCPYTVYADGLTSSLLDSASNSIDICGNPCVIDAENSDATQTTCTLPYVSTAYSADNYEIVVEGMIHDGTWTGTASDEELAKLIDDKNMIDMQDDSSSCYFQLQYKENHVGVLDEVKFFVNKLIDKSPFVDNLVFQGSDDGENFTDLWTISKSVHEGWNTKDFEEDRPSFNIYRFQGAQAGSCRIGEVRLHGVESIDSDTSSYSCQPKMTVDGVVTELEPVTFDAAFTPVLTGMSTRFGSVLGGETVEFYGTDFSDTAITTVTIDNRVCEVSTSTVDTITCVTDDKPYVPDTPKLEIYIEGLGLVATKGKVFMYISRWSDDQTWGYDLSPQLGEAVNIPVGLHLLVDVDSTPILSFINVQGSLIFPSDDDPDHHRTLDAHYILVKGGYMEVGTEENRYTSKITITMHSTRYDPNLPIFGNKVIGVNYGVLEMHGVERKVTWTDLKETVQIGETSITLNDVTGDPLDWQVGEQIVIASTDFAGRNAEMRTIASITNTDTNPVITFDEPLIHKHYAGIQYFGDDFIEMRAEVGLLTRNVKYQGDETSTDDQYGAVIIMHSPGDETTAARIDSIELTHVGQAFILGSYPIHFHMIGTVHSSYVRNNAIHHTFNRAVTIHGVHYLRVQNNVAYHTMGHTIFIEDAAETKNLIEYNLIVDVRRSWSLLNTDQTPAAIWITSPDNIIRYNHAAGSDRYSYWYDLQTTAIGPSYDENICPENDKLGEFTDNVAHSNGRYGLRIFHNLMPRTYPCEPMVYDSTDPNNPYPANPPIIAKFYNLVSYKNKRDGAIAEKVGAVQWHNFKVADNLEAGMEISSLTGELIDNYAKIVGGLVIGRSENTEEALDWAHAPVGVKNPRTENFRVEGVKFYNFNWNGAAAMGTCSHCWHDNNTDSGARTVVVNDLYFDETVQQKVFYTVPWRTIFFDETGGLTGLGPNTWFLAHWKHLLQPECSETTGGIICDDSVEVRRVAFWGLPSNFYGMRLKIAKIDNTVVGDMSTEEYEAYLENQDNYSIVPFKDKKDPAGWAMPFVTGKKYRLHWESGLDFDVMKVSVSERWQPTDQNTFFEFNFTEAREAVNFTNSYGGGELLPDGELIIKPSSEYVSGDNWVRNDTDIRTFQFVINGREESNKSLLVEPLECITGVCLLEEVIEVELEEGQRLWSDPESWPEGEIPIEGEEVEILSGWNMLLDLEETPKLKSLTINGRLSLIQSTEIDIHIRTEKIFVRAGEFFIGSEEEPFQNNALITLLGDQEVETLRLSGTVDGGNKVIGVTNVLQFYGKQRVNHRRLLSTVYGGQDEIIVEEGHDWEVGDEIYLAPTSMQAHHSDYMTIAEIIGSKLVLTEPLKYYHFGGGDTSSMYDGVDTRGEVYLLTRNIKIVGEDLDNWGGQVLATDLFEADGTWRKGSIIMDSVQVYNCSQQDTFHSSIRFEGAIGGYSRISNSAVHNGNDWAMSILNAANIDLFDNVFVGFRNIGMRIDSARNCTIDGNFIGDVRARGIDFVNEAIDKEACVAYCSLESEEKGTPCYDMTVTNNIAAGCPFAAWIAPGYEECGKNTKNFYKNIGHSSLGYGAYIYPPPQAASKTSKCFEASHFTGYKNFEPCVVTMAKTLDHRVHDLKCLDNAKGLSLNTGDQEADEVEITLSDSFFYGETLAEDCVPGADCFCEPKFAMMNMQNMNDGKPLMPTMASSLPIYNSHGEGNWGGKIKIEDCTFKNFMGLTRCGSPHQALSNNPGSSDKIPPHFFDNTKFIDTDDYGFVFLAKPDPGWANVKDCGNFPCTAPNNLIYSFKQTTYKGRMPAFAYRDFTLVPDDETVGGTYPGCSHMKEGQAFACRTNNIGMLMFENLDDDAWDRAIQPIFLVNEKTGFNNTLNAMMDHIWDTFYTGQRRMGRFPAALYTDEDYTMLFSGTNPKKVRFYLDARQGATKIKIPYPVAGSIQVTANGKKKSYTPWDDSIGKNAPLTKNKGCGENRFVGIENYLEFYITPGCEILIEPKDAILTKVRMDWTMAEFFAEGGTTRFVDRLAASLGIDSYRIKTVAVYEGSVVVEFSIDPLDDEDAEAAADELAAVQNILVTQVESGNLDIGAPIMGLEGTESELLFGDPIPAGPGATTSNYDGEGNTAIVGDSNLWDDLQWYDHSATVTVTEPKTEETTAPVEESTTPVASVEVPVTETTQTQTSNGVIINPVSPTVNTQTSSEVESTTVAAQVNEKPRDIIVKKKIVEVIEEYEVTAEAEEKSDNKMLIIIAGAVVGVLVITAIVMTIRFCQNKDGQVRKVVANTKFKSETNEIEPQFVLAADDSKNIFSAAGTGLAIDDAIENAEDKKTTSKKKKTKKIVVRKINKDSNSPASPVEEDKGEDSDENDDGFRNHQSPEASVRSPDANSSRSRFFNTQSRDSNAKMMSTGEIAIKLHSVQRMEE